MMRISTARQAWPAYLLGAVTMLLGLVLFRAVASPPAALAQIPDSGAQRVAMLTELRGMNVKLGEIAATLRQIRDQKAAGKTAADTGAVRRRSRTRP